MPGMRRNERMHFGNRHGGRRKSGRNLLRKFVIDRMPEEDAEELSAEIDLASEETVEDVIGESVMENIAAIGTGLSDDSALEPQAPKADVVTFGMSSIADIPALMALCSAVSDGMADPDMYVSVPAESFLRASDEFDQTAFCVVARVGQSIAGFFAFERLDLDGHGVAEAAGLTEDALETTWSAYNVAVLPGYRGLRLMQRMLEVGEGEAVKRGALRFVAKTAPDNIPSRRVFEGDGYQPIATATFGGRYEGLTRVVLRKDMIR